MPTPPRQRAMLFGSGQPGWRWAVAMRMAAAGVSVPVIVGYTALVVRSSVLVSMSQHAEVGRIGYDLLAQSWMTPADKLLADPDNWARQVERMTSR